MAFVGIFVEDTEVRARKFADTYKVSFPHGYDWELKLAKPFGFRGMPYTVVFNQKGLEAKRFAGPVSKTDLVNIIETLLKNS